MLVCSQSSHLSFSSGIYIQDLNLKDHTNQAIALSKLLTNEEEKKKLASASKWCLNTVYAFNIFLDPTDDMDKVLPHAAEPSQDGK